MTSLLEFREKIKLIYGKNEVFILPVVKFLLAFLSLSVVNGQLGYMDRLDNIALVLIVSLLCSFLPMGCTVLFAALFSLLHMYDLSLEAALVGFCLYLVMFLVFFRFHPKGSIVVLLTPILFIWKIPYVMPIAAGLLGSPAVAVSVACGAVIYYFIHNITEIAPAISNMDDGEATARLRMVIDGLLNNKAMIVVIIAFVLTVVVVYLIRRMSIDYSWTIAMIAGVIFNLMILLVGDLLYDTNIAVGGAVLGSLLAIVVAKILEFFRFCVDYNRTEKVQFEDDEYYYYVKAVPKMTVPAQAKTVKRINPQRSNAGAGRGRSVTTERTPGGRNQGTRSGAKPGNRSITINSNMAEDVSEDFEDWE